MLRQRQAKVALTQLPGCWKVLFNHAKSSVLDTWPKAAKGLQSSAEKETRQVNVVVQYVPTSWRTGIFGAGARHQNSWPSDRERVTASAMERLTAIGTPSSVQRCFISERDVVL